MAAKDRTFIGLFFYKCAVDVTAQYLSNNYRVSREKYRYLVGIQCLIAFNGLV